MGVKWRVFRACEWRHGGEVEERESGLMKSEEATIADECREGDRAERLNYHIIGNSG